MFQLTQIAYVLLSLLCLALIYRGLTSALSRTDFAEKKQQNISRQFLIGIGAWLLLISILALVGFFKEFSQFPPRLILTLVPPLVFILWLTIFSKNLAAILRVIPPAHLLYIQSFRIFVELLIWLLFIQTLLPIQMTFEGYNYDILTGLTAPIFAYYCFVKKKWSRQVAILWNIAGLILVFTIVTIAMLSFPTPFQYFMNEPSNRIVATFPFVYLPAVLVTIAYSMHFFSLKQLLLQSKE